jgi:hypothetical protein
LTFLYTWNYATYFEHGGGAKACAPSSSDSVLAHALFNIKVYVAADKYGVTALQQQAAALFGASLFRTSPAASSPPDSNKRKRRPLRIPSSMLQRQPQPQPQQQHEYQRLTPAALTTIVDEVYNGVAAELPDNRLRDVVALVVSYEISSLMGEPAFVALLEGGHANSGEGRRCCIAVDAAKFLAQRLSPNQNRYRCPSCLKQFEALPHPGYKMPCFHCNHLLSLWDWASNVVLPDMASLWQKSEEKKSPGDVCRQ